MPNGKLVIVGYADPSEGVNASTVEAQRAVNVEYYFTVDGPNKVVTDRMSVRQGGSKAKETHFYFVPAGELCSSQQDLGNPVDETKVKGQTRTPPGSSKKTAPPQQ